MEEQFCGVNEILRYEMNSRFKGRRALVTGGASGIGEATARLLVAEGAKVAIADVDAERARLLVSELGETKLLFAKCDVAEFEQVVRAVEQAKFFLSGIDLLVNCAGIGVPLGVAPDVDPAAWRRTMSVNLDSVFYFCRAVIPHLRISRGSAVNVASISGAAADRGFSAYNASKAGLINYTRTLALDHAEEGIRFNSVSPGYVDTPLTSSSRARSWRAAWIAASPMKRTGNPVEIAKAIAFLLSDDASFITGADLVADGGLSAWTGNPAI